MSPLKNQVFHFRWEPDENWIFRAFLVASNPSDFHWELDENGAVVITGLVDTYKTLEVVVPDEIDGRPVVAVGEDAFAYCFSLTSVSLPKGLQTLGKSAFNNCSSLTSVSLPDGL